MKKRILSMVLVGCLCMTACQNKNSDTGVNGVKEAVATASQTPTPEQTVNPVVVEEEVINNFYNTMCDVRNDFANFEYTTVAEEVQTLSVSVNAFKNQHKIQTGQYKMYFHKMITSNIFKYIDKKYIQSMKDFDSDIYKQKSHALILQNCLELLLKEKLPVKNDRSTAMMKELNKHHSDGRNTKKGLKLLKAFQRTGWNAKQDNINYWYQRIPKKNIPSKASYKAAINPILYIATEGDGRGLSIYFYTTKIKFNNALSRMTFIAGKKKIKPRQEKVNSFKYGEVVYNQSVLYSSDDSAKKNKDYDKVKALFNNNDKVKAKIGNKVVKVYNKKEMDIMNEYFVVFDIILGLYS